MGAGLLNDVEGDQLEQSKYQIAHRQIVANALACKIGREIDPGCTVWLHDCPVCHVPGRLPP